MDLEYGVIINIPGDEVRVVGPWRKGELMGPKEVMNRVKLIFPGATIGEDADGQVIINTDMKLIGEGVTERFIPFKKEEAQTPVEDSKSKPPKS